MTVENIIADEQDQRKLACDAIRDAQRIAIACHVNPDGDALGSLIGLGLAIESVYPSKDVLLLAQDGVPFIYRFLPGSDRVQTGSQRRDIDLAIVVDSGDLTRVGSDVLPVIASATTVIDIDHHVGDGAFGAVRLLDNRAAATAEIIFDLIQELGAPLSRDIATCLFTGVITDTGSFRFMNVTPRTLRVAASLIEAGASPSLISENVFDNRPFPATKLMGLTLSSLTSTDDGKISWASVTRDNFRATQTTDGDTEGFINFVRAIRGTEVGLLFREVEPSHIRVSLRSTEHVDVAAVAAQFGGGGHRMASGLTFDGPLADAITQIVAAVSAMLPPAS